MPFLGPAPAPKSVDWEDAIEVVREEFDDILSNLDPDEPRDKVLVSEIREKIVDALKESIEGLQSEHEQILEELYLQIDSLESELESSELEIEELKERE